jgi:carboxypeptidase C (cathepsin A)
MNNVNATPTLPSAQDLLVSGLEKISGYEAFGLFEGQMYAGLLPMNHDDRSGNIMFWLFEPKQQTFSNSMVMWLNGGPGCSSFNCGVLMEICTCLCVVVPIPQCQVSPLFVH